jgi:hypothetical protein
MPGNRCANCVLWRLDNLIGPLASRPNSNVRLVSATGYSQLYTIHSLAITGPQIVLESI